MLQTMRSHDQWNTTIYSADDRYRGVRNIRELIFMNRKDMRDRGIAEGDLVDIVATSRDGSVRSITAFRALEYYTPGASAARPLRPRQHPPFRLGRLRCGKHGRIDVVLLGRPQLA